MPDTNTAADSNDTDEPDDYQDILTVFRVTHPRLVLSKTIEHDSSAFLRPIREAGTDPTSQRYLYCVCSDDFEHFETGLKKDPTVREFERVLRIRDTAIYTFSYTEDILLFSTEIVQANGIVLDIRNEGPIWVVKAWLPSREVARELWDFADEHGIEMSIDRINPHASIVSNSYGVTDAQREALMTALESGYFDEPRSTTLDDLAYELGVSQPALSGLLRRGFRRLLESTLAEDEDEGAGCLGAIL